MFAACTAGPPGADATAVLPPTDGRMQLLLQPHTGAVAVAAHAQLLPLQVALPAVDAVSAVVSALSTESEEDQQHEFYQLNRETKLLAHFRYAFY